MNSSSIFINNAIPEEYRKIAKKLFPAEGFSSQKGLSQKAAFEFAAALGIGKEYKRLLNLINAAGPKMSEFLNSFQNNLDLLIQKTWVEKSDETRKEKLQADIPGFIKDIENKNFLQALEEFSVILDELAYLFFGAQSTHEDFAEYTFRIDEQMGLFWWYGAHLGFMINEIKNNNTEDESLWAVLLIGICYLTNF